MLHTFPLPAAYQNAVSRALLTSPSWLWQNGFAASFTILEHFTVLGPAWMCHLRDRQKQRNGRGHFFLRRINFINKIQVMTESRKIKHHAISSVIYL